MPSLPLMVIAAALTTGAGPAPAHPASDTLWLRQGALFGAYTLVVRPEANTAAMERFLRRDYFPAWATLIPGSRVY